MPSTVLAQIDRAAINRANTQHSTGPRTESGKQRSSLNALRHGLAAHTAVLASEDQAAYNNHCRKFFDEYQPANPTQTQLVQEIADTSRRLNCIPLLEAELFAAVPSPQSLVPLLNIKEFHGIPPDMASFFLKDEVECCSQRMMRQNEARHIAWVRFQMPVIPAPGQ